MTMQSTLSKQQLMQIHSLYQKLIPLLGVQKDPDLSFIISTAKDSMTLIEAYFNLDNSSEDTRVTTQILLSKHKVMNQPRVGLADYFIWNDSLEERIKLNQALDEIKHNLNDIFNTL